MAEAQELITPIPANQLLDATPAQTQMIQRLRQRPTTQSLDLVHVDIGALRGDTMRVSIPNTPTLMLAKRNEDIRSPSDFTWYGTLSGVPGQATLVVHDGNITGSIQDQGALYRIEPVGNGVHALIKVDQGRFPPEHPPSFEQKERRGDIQAPAPMQDISRSDGPVGIDVRRLYHSGPERCGRHQRDHSAGGGGGKSVLCEQWHQHQALFGGQLRGRVFGDR